MNMISNSLLSMQVSSHAGNCWKTGLKFSLYSVIQATFNKIYNVTLFLDIHTLCVTEEKQLDVNESKIAYGIKDLIIP